MPVEVLDGFVGGPNQSWEDNPFGRDSGHLHGCPSRYRPRIDLSGWPLVGYVTDVRMAMTRAKQAAGDQDVSVHGAAVAQLALRAGVLNELKPHVVPVLLGAGQRLFDDPGREALELDRARVLEGEYGFTHLRYRVRRPRGE